jgi:tricarballylate dehydrogenase
VRARKPSGRTEYRGDAVVLAAGGFQANPAWRARYLGPGWDLVKVRGSRYDTGDGLQMALDAGAAAYGHWSGAHSTNWDLNAPDMNVLADNTIFKRDDFNYGVMINARGERFVDEGEDLGGFIYAKMGPAILAQPGGFAWQVYDKKVDRLIHPEYRSPRARRVVAGSLEELAAGMSGVDPAGFLSTIAAFNAAVDDAHPFQPGQHDGRGTRGLAIDKSNWAQAIDTPPFQAYGVTSGITFTFGGVRVDATARVLDVSGAPLRGLFAAGEMIGGLFYSNYPGGASLAAAAVFGRLAGQAAAAG